MAAVGVVVVMTDLLEVVQLICEPLPRWIQELLLRVAEVGATQSVALLAVRVVKLDTMAVEVIILVTVPHRVLWEQGDAVVVALVSDLSVDKATNLRVGRAVVAGTLVVVGHVAREAVVRALSIPLVPMWCLQRVQVRETAL
jgi:hypothetical protein